MPSQRHTRGRRAVALALALAMGAVLLSGASADAVGAPIVDSTRDVTYACPAGAGLQLGAGAYADRCCRPALVVDLAPPSPPPPAAAKKSPPPPPAAAKKSPPPPAGVPRYDWPDLAYTPPRALAVCLGEALRLTWSGGDPQAPTRTGSSGCERVSWGAPPAVRQTGALIAPARAGDVTLRFPALGTVYLVDSTDCYKTRVKISVIRC